MPENGRWDLIRRLKVNMRWFEDISKYIEYAYGQWMEQTERTATGMKNVHSNLQTDHCMPVL